MRPQHTRGKRRVPLQPVGRFCTLVIMWATLGTSAGRVGITASDELGTITLSPVAAVRQAEQCAAFVDAVVRLLQRRTLGKKWSMQHWLQDVATPRDAKGEWAEFGVKDGRSISIIARARQRLLRQGGYGAMVPVHGFDSFVGLPHDERGWKAASHASKKAGPPFDDAVLYAWHAGWFNETVPTYVAQLQHNLTFVHIDCDLYSSTATILGNIAGKLAPGIVIAFDELVNYPGYEDGEVRALYELLLATGRTVRMISAAGPLVARVVPSHGYIKVRDRNHHMNAVVQLL